MQFSIDVNIITLPCQHSQDDGTNTYYAFEIVGLTNKYGGSNLVVRSSESAYPGNDSIMQFMLAQLSTQIIE